MIRAGQGLPEPLLWWKESDPDILDMAGVVHEALDEWLDEEIIEFEWGRVSL